MNHVLFTMGTVEKMKLENDDFYTNLQSVFLVVFLGLNILYGLY